MAFRMEGDSTKDGRAGREGEGDAGDVNYDDKENIDAREKEESDEEYDDHDRERVPIFVREQSDFESVAGSLMEEIRRSRDRGSHSTSSSSDDRKHSKRRRSYSGEHGSEDEEAGQGMEEWDTLMRRNYPIKAPPAKKWLFLFPTSIDKCFAPMDDAIIRIFQKPRGQFVTLFSLLITLITTIEVCIPIPFILYVVGYDGLATQFTYLAILTCLISQIPKRFLWRYRPYMLKRAELRRKDQTSSFPSRAVTCAVVYGVAICWGYIYRMNEGFIIEWWMPVLVITLVLLSSFARINLGVHYPSDCLGGIIQGAIICAIGLGLWTLNVEGCSTCRDQDCYSTGNDQITWERLDRINWLIFFGILALLTFIVIISLVRPIEFWVTFLCPGNYNTRSSLPEPEHVWYSYLYGIFFGVLFTVLPLLTKGKWPFLSWAFLFICGFFSLTWWRLFITSTAS